MSNKISLDVKETKSIYLSLESDAPPINVNVSAGSVIVMLSKTLFTDSDEKRPKVELKTGDSIVVQAPAVRVRNSGDGVAKCEFSVVSGN